MCILCVLDSLTVFDLSYSTMGENIVTPNVSEFSLRSENWNAKNEEMNLFAMINDEFSFARYNVYKC